MCQGNKYGFVVETKNELFFEWTGLEPFKENAHFTEPPKGSKMGGTESLTF